jgi:carbon storage regulator
VLVLRRNCGQSIVIGKNAKIIIKILRDENGVVSVGVKAPKSVLVDRLEVYEKRQPFLNPSNEIINNS